MNEEERQRRLAELRETQWQINEEILAKHRVNMRRYERLAKVYTDKARAEAEQVRMREQIRQDLLKVRATEVAPTSAEEGAA